jgi:hypothetical protein
MSIGFLPFFAIKKPTGHVAIRLTVCVTENTNKVKVKKGKAVPLHAMKALGGRGV